MKERNTPLKLFQGIKSKITIYKNNFLFKEIKKDGRKLQYELIAQKLGKLAKLNVLKFLKEKNLKGKTGLLMNYEKDAVLLQSFKRNLNKEQKRQLQKIILFDILIGNSDRHTANILVSKNNLIAFDHETLFKSSQNGSDFIKIDFGKRLNKDYISRIEGLIASQSRLTTKQVLTKYFNFKSEDFNKLKKIDSKKIKKIIKDSALDRQEKEKIYKYLIFRKENFDRMIFIK